MPKRIVNPKSQTAMQQLKAELSQQATDPNKVLFCGKLRIDRDSVTGYLKTGRHDKRRAFFDQWPDRHDFGTVAEMQTQFGIFCKPNKIHYQKSKLP